MLGIKEYALSLNQYLAKVFAVLALGLFTSAASSFLLIQQFPEIINLPFVSILAAILQLGLVFMISARIKKLSVKTAWILYVVYAVLTGFTLATILLSFSIQSIAMSFTITAVVFVSMAIIGYRTNIDLTKYSSYFVVALVMIIVISIINGLLFHISGMDLLLLYGGTLLFLAFVAYDVQMIRKLYYQASDQPELLEKLIILGALELYLDFINLFIRVLEIFSDN